MEDSKIKRSALMSAYLRGYHAVHETPKIFNDFLAHHLLKEEERTAFEQTMVTTLQLVDPERAAACEDRTAMVACMLQSYFPTSLFLSRARYAEDRLESAIRQGTKQYLILGAGMDTFAFRHPETLKDIQVFEIDHPATQAFKRRRLTELGWELPSNLHFVPLDFTKENLETALARSSFDAKSLSFFSWLGVIHYLPREAVFSSLHSIANLCPAGSSVTFDYWDTDAFDTERTAKRVKLMQEMLRSAGEPMLTGLDPSTLPDELLDIRLRLQEHWSPAHIQGHYFQGRTDGYYAYEHSHFANAVVE